MAEYTANDYLNGRLEYARKNGSKLLDRSIEMLERALDDIRRYRDEYENASDYDRANRLTWTAQAFTNIANNAKQAEMGEVAGMLWGLKEAMNTMTEWAKHQH